MVKFSSYMQEWLYGKEGYYTDFKKIGKEGDFYTAVSATPFFGGAIAKRIIKIIKDGFLPENSTILEIGAHQGYLLADIVQFIYTLEPKLLKTINFAILEPQKNILLTQKKYMEQSFGDEINIKYFSSFNELKLDNAFIISNEIFDAFKCEVIKDDKMLYVENDKFYFDDMNDEIQEKAKKYSIKKGEIAVGYDEFAYQLSNHIKRFEFVSFDYGEMEHRGEYSLRVYHKHQVYPFFSLTRFAQDEKLKSEGIDIKLLYKNSDITYDVFFRQLIDEFEKAGIKKEYYMTQMKAMVEFGILELFEILKNNSDETTYLKELNKAKVLIDPSFMGERFKCIIFRKID